jgi:hypothetical protein
LRQKPAAPAASSSNHLQSMQKSFADRTLAWRLLITLYERCKTDEANQGGEDERQKQNSHCR